MRNLKKILALVLALVMSLSLMATASAADFTDAGSVNDTYALAAKVLNGVEVFRGYEDGSFKPQNNITRAEVAAIVYRIATGDVKDTQAGIYSTWGKFNDVLDNQWFAGYVNYCANAGYVKGRDAKTFDPGANVTGYEVLAMILRAVGYGQNGEFEGANWAINTASIARREGVTKNVVDALLGQPATREMVAELLFQAMFVECVDYNMLTGYAKNGKNLAKEELNLEKEPNAVIIANEWAALDASSPLAAGKTKVEKADGTFWTINWSAGDLETGADYATGVKDIGKSRDIYVQNGSKVISLADTGKNDVKDNEGKKTTVSDLAGSISTKGAEYYDNFDPAVVNYCEMRIEYNLRFVDDAAAKLFFEDYCSASWEQVEKIMTKDTVAGYKYAYVKVIGAEKDISSTELAIMKGIFTIADNANKTLGIDASVYIGTKSDSSDYSDSASYKTFMEKEIKERENPISSVANGNWLQVVDNDADGVAEYVLRVNYDLDTIVENKSDKFYYRGLNIDNFTPVEINGYTQTVGDVVLYAAIDGKAYVHKADTATASFKTIDYKAEKATDTDGKVWEQSGINNHTTLPEKLVDVDELTSYNMYLDDYGYVRAYDNKINYALLTEMYPTSDWNSAWVVSRDLTVEAMPVGDTAVREYKVLNSWYVNNANSFFTGIEGGWNYPGITNVRNNIQYTNRPNYLRSATHMLDVPGREGNTFWYGDRDVYVQDGRDQEIDRFNYNSWTNVAKYTQTADGLNLYTAAGVDGNRVQTDYIRLNAHDVDWRTINKNNPLFRVADDYYDEVYTSADSHYVRAVDNTVFFLVTVTENGTTQAIRQYTGYKNVPTITGENHVRSMYAVARNTNNDKNVNGNPYWVGDVIVIEMYDYDAYESIALIYSNNYKNQGDVKYVEAIDSVKGEISIIPNNYNVWNGRFTGLGFYGLNNIVAVEGQENTYTADITRIQDSLTADDRGWLEDNEYNKHGIYYGQVRSLYSEDAYSNYVTLDLLDHNNLVVGTKDVRVTLGAWGIKDTKSNNINNAVPLLLKSTTVSNKVLVGDRVIWVETSDKNAARTAGFLVDVTDHKTDAYGVITKRSWYPTPAFLNTEALQISRAQWTDKTPNADWNYEEIIGKRNDLTVTPKRVDEEYNVWDEQDGFVLNRYTLSVNSVAQKPVYDGIMADGLWHIRYKIPDGAVVTVDVERNGWVAGRGTDLVLNSAKRDVVSSKPDRYIVGSGIDVTADQWSFAMPTLARGVKVIGTIFADGTTIPANTIYDVPDIYRETLLAGDITFGNVPVDPDEEIKAELATKKAAALTALETIRDQLVEANPDKADGINAAYAAAAEKINNVTLDAYKADNTVVDTLKTAGEAAMNAAAEGEGPGPVDPEKVTVTVKVEYTTDGIRNDELDWTKTYEAAKNAETFTVPFVDVEKWVAPSYTATVNGVDVERDADDNYVIAVPADTTAPIVMKVSFNLAHWGEKSSSQRMAVRTLANEEPVRLTGTLATRKGMMPDKNAELLGEYPDSFEIDWTTLVKATLLGKVQYWTVEATVAAADKDATITATPGVTVDTWVPTTNVTLKIVDKNGKDLADYAKYVDVRVNGQAYTGQKLEAYNFLTIQKKENVLGITGIDPQLRVDGKKASNMYTIAENDAELVVTVTITPDLYIRNEGGTPVRNFTKPETSMSLAKYLDQYTMPAGSTVVFHFVDSYTNEPFTVTLVTDAAGNTTSDVDKVPVRSTQEIADNIWVELTAVTGDKATYGDVNGAKDAVKITVTAANSKVAPAEAKDGVWVAYGNTLEVTITPDAGYTIDMAQFETLKGVVAVETADGVKLTITSGEKTTATISVTATKAETVKAEDVTTGSENLALPEDVKELEVEIVEDASGNKTTEIPVVVKPLESGDKKIDLVPVVDGKPVEKNEDGTYNLPATVDEDGKVTLDEVQLESAPQDLTLNEEGETKTEGEKPLGEQAIILKSKTETEGGQDVNDKSDKVTFSSASVVYDETGKAQRVEGIVESPDEPVLDEAAKQAGVTVEPYVEATKAVSLKWIIKIPCAEASAVVTIDNKKVSINITFVVPSDNADLDKVKAEAKKYLDQFVALYEADNSLINKWFNNAGELTNGSGDGANFKHNDHISAEVRNSASPLCAYNLAQGITAIKKMITEAADEAAVKAIFWYDEEATGEMYSSMGWDSTATTSDMCKNFGVSGDLKAYIWEELQMMNVKQTYLDTFDATTETGAAAKQTILTAKYGESDPEGAQDSNRGTMRMAAAVKKIADAAKSPAAATTKAYYVNALKKKTEGFEVNYDGVKKIYTALVALYVDEAASAAAESESVITASQLTDVWDAAKKELKAHADITKLTEAVKKAQAGEDTLVPDGDGNITLLVDQNLTARWEISSAVKVIDLNGKTINYSKADVAEGEISVAMKLADSANVTVKNGTVSMNGDRLNAFWADKNTTLTIAKDVTVLVPGADSYGIMIWEGTAESSSPATVTINGAIEGYDGIYVNGNTSLEHVINVNGTIDASDVAIYQSGKSNIILGTGCVVKGGVSAIEIGNGNLKVTPGAQVFGGQGDWTTRPMPDNGGSVGINAGIVVAASKSGAKITVEIMSGAKIQGQEYKLAFTSKSDTYTLATGSNVTFINDVIAAGEYLIDWSTWTTADSDVAGGLVKTTVTLTSDASTETETPAAPAMFGGEEVVIPDVGEVLPEEPGEVLPE